MRSLLTAVLLTKLYKHFKCPGMTKTVDFDAKPQHIQTNKNKCNDHMTNISHFCFRFVSMRVMNVYDVDNKTYLIRLGK